MNHQSLTKGFDPSTVEDALLDAADLAWAKQALHKIKDGVKSRILGQDEVVERSILAMVAGGHVLIEGPTGTGKTKLSQTFGQAMGMRMVRIQGQNDLMPADIIGHDVMVPNAETGKNELVFEEGPVRDAQFVHFDEINRVTPRSQSAMLSIMEERKFTHNKMVYPLDNLFTVFATQNPEGQEGTYPLPEAQVDRFMMRVDMLNPKDIETQVAINRLKRSETRTPPLEKMITPDELRKIREMHIDVAVGENVDRYIAHIARAACDKNFAPKGMQDTFNYSALMLRGDRGQNRISMSLDAVARAKALMDGRARVELSDVDFGAEAVLIHRMGAPRNMRDFAAPGTAIQGLLVDMKQEI